MSMTVLAPIPIWFVCKLCRGLFHEIDKFVKHEKDVHSVDFASVKCIVFEVTAAVINHNQDLPPEFLKILNEQEEPSHSRSSYLERLDKLTQDIFSQRIQYEYETLSAGQHQHQHQNHTLATTGTGNASQEEIQHNQPMPMETMNIDVSPAQVIPYEFEFEQDIKVGRQLQLSETKACVGSRYRPGPGTGTEPKPLATNDEIATSLLPCTDYGDGSCDESIVIKCESEFEPVVFNGNENEWRLYHPKKVKEEQVILENEDKQLNREDGALHIFARKKKIKTKSPFNPYVLLERLSPTEIQNALGGKFSGADLDPEPEPKPVKCIQMASHSGPSNSNILSTQTSLGQRMELMHGSGTSGSREPPEDDYIRSAQTIQSEVGKQVTTYEYLCEICDKVFSARSCLEKHHLVVHAEDRPYKCKWEYCRATFKTESEFIQHEGMLHRKLNYKKICLGLSSLHCSRN